MSFDETFKKPTGHHDRENPITTPTRGCPSRGTIALDDSKSEATFKIVLAKYDASYMG